jgi:hypothetical protein
LRAKFLYYSNTAKRKVKEQAINVGRRRIIPLHPLGIRFLHHVRDAERSGLGRRLPKVGSTIALVVLHLHQGVVHGAGYDAVVGHGARVFAGVPALQIAVV